LTTNEEKKIYQGAVGVKIVLETGQDLSESTTHKILVQKPDGSELEWAADISAVIEDKDGRQFDVTPKDGYIEYITSDGDLDQSGDYLLQAYVEWEESKHYGKTCVMEIREKFD